MYDKYIRCLLNEFTEDKVISRRKEARARMMKERQPTWEKWEAAHPVSEGEEGYKPLVASLKAKRADTQSQFNSMKGMAMMFHKGSPQEKEDAMKKMEEAFQRAQHQLQEKEILLESPTREGWIKTLEREQLNGIPYLAPAGSRWEESVKGKTCAEAAKIITPTQYEEYRRGYAQATLNQSRHVEFVKETERFRQETSKAPTWLGLVVRQEPAGLAVTYIEPYSPAFKAGLRKGDHLTHWMNAKLEKEKTLTSWVKQSKPGSQIKIAYLRGSASADTIVTLGEEP